MHLLYLYYDQVINEYSQSQPTCSRAPSDSNYTNYGAKIISTTNGPFLCLKLLALSPKK